MRYLHILCLFGAIVLAPLRAVAVPKTPTPTPSPTPAAVRFGAFIALSGDQPEKALQMRQALELKVEKLQAAGGINGRPVELYVEDTGDEKISPGTIIRSLLTEKHSDVLIGDVTIERTLPYITLANTYRTPLLSPALHDSALPTENRLAFGMYPRRPTVRDAILKFFKVAGNPNSIVIFCSHTALGLGLLDAVHDAAQQSNIQIKDEICTEEALHDYRPDVTRAQGIAPSSLFLTQGTTQILQWMGSMGFSVQTLAGPDFRDSVVTRGLDTTQFEGVYYLDWPVRETFAKEYRDKYGKDPILLAALAADAVDLVVEALKKSPDSITVGLHQLQDVGQVGSYDFTAEQAGNSASARLFRIEKGVAVPVP